MAEMCIGIRDTRHRNVIQITRRKYQRASRNWNTGRLTYTYHMPAGVSCGAEAAPLEYHVATSSAVT